jgi:fimbrial chaperone protein
LKTKKIMWPRFLRLRLAAALLAANAAVSYAASLQVEPVLVDVKAPSAAATLTLRNGGPAPINAQIRVFRWSQTDGMEKLQPTTDVVASPPDANLTPKADYVVRIVRVLKQPVASEEGYRLLVDELPSPVQWQGRTVNLLVRNSIPVFFAPPQLGDPSVTWAVSVQGDKLSLSAQNNGDRRLRISSLRVRNSIGEVVTFGNGLLGYVLGRSSMNWATPGSARSFVGASTVSISAESDLGPIQAVATVIRRP